MIEEGAEVVITTADGSELPAVARSRVEQKRDERGLRIHDFPVVWVDAPRRDGHGVVRIPWPADAVRLQQLG